MVTLAPNELGADLIAWRTSKGMRTTVSLLWSPIESFPDPVHLRADLFGARGEARRSWRTALPCDRPVFIDSACEGPWRGFEGDDGVLALYVCTEGEASEAARSAYNRLFPLVDWRTADGRIATLHSDQVIQRGTDAPQRFTEIVVTEDAGQVNSLVFLNGAETQDEGALRLEISNMAGDRRAAAYPHSIAPFTATRVELRSLFPEIVAFAASGPLLVEGAFAARGVRLRPYVETTGRRWGVYHAGNVYDWTGLPFFAHALIGGEVNPMAALHDAGIRTFVNVLHSHDGMDGDVDVDAALFDTSGVCVARRAGWLRARRNALARAELAELLPDPGSPFRGHLALSFAPSPGHAVPRRLQALLEYRSGNGIAHVMAWSDEWNSRRRVALRERNPVPLRYRSWFRVMLDPGVETTLSITNAGHPGHDRPAQVQASLHGAAGTVASAEFELAPFASRLSTVDELFPGASRALAPTGLGIVLVESVSDLANVGFTRTSSGALAAEHFMSLQSSHDGGAVFPSGS